MRALRGLERLRLGPSRFRATDLLVLAAAALLVVQAPLSVTAAAWVPGLEPLPRLALLGLLTAYLTERTRLLSSIGLLLSLLLGVEVVTWTYATVQSPTDLQSGVSAVGVHLGTWLDTVASGGVSDDQLVFALAMGGLAWLLGMLSAWLLFRDNAPWLAVVFNGIALLLNLSYAAASLIGYVGWFAFAACLVLAAQQLANRAELWRRAQLAVDWRILANVLLGTTVVSGALLLVAWTLPANAASPDVAADFTRATAPWQGMEGTFDRWFASLNGSQGAVRGLSFGRTLAPRGAFDLADTPVLSVKASSPVYLRATTADDYTGQAMTSTDASTTSADANTDLLPQNQIPLDRGVFQAQVTVLASRTSVAFAPDAPLRVSLPTELDSRGTPEDVAALRLQQPVQQNQSYSIVSAVSTATISELRAAGEDYPDWVRQRDLQLPRRIPRRVIDLAHQVTTGATSAYDKGAALESYLRDNYTYSTHVPTVPPNRDWVDYFLFDSKQGYCDYFATTMVVLLRIEGVPARVASGFAPGDFDPATQLTTVRENHAHSWVEAYFPRYGWITFEPSAIRPVPTRLDQPPPAAPTAVAPPADTSTDANLTPSELDELLSLQAGGGAAPASRPFFTTLPGILALIGAGVLMILAIGAAGLAVAWNRSLHRLAVYQRPYAQLLRLSAWLGGLRPRGSDTPYEIAEALARSAPPAAGAIRELTDAYVEGTYAGRPPRQDPWPAWLAARRRLVSALLRRRFRRAERERRA